MIRRLKPKFSHVRTKTTAYTWKYAIESRVLIAVPPGSLLRAVCLYHDESVNLFFVGAVDDSGTLYELGLSACTFIDASHVGDGLD